MKNVCTSYFMRKYLREMLNLNFGYGFFFNKKTDILIF